MKPSPLTSAFIDTFGRPPTIQTSAPGRLEVLGNHTDYNHGLTLSCAIAFRCHAAFATIDQPEARLKSTAFEGPPVVFPLRYPVPRVQGGHWANYILGLVNALHDRGHATPGFALMLDSEVPRSAGVSSSAALEMAALTALAAELELGLPPVELARIGQWAESRAVGAQTGLLDQLTSLCGKRGHLLLTDFQSLDYRTVPLPPGWVFVAVDSGVKHDLTQDYNHRRASCEAAGAALGVVSLRDAKQADLESRRGDIPEDAYHCASHIFGENQRVKEAEAALSTGDVKQLGRLMFDSHDSSRDFFRNSCPELDVLIDLARRDERCVGARLSGGGFGGISIHLVRESEAEAYRQDILQAAEADGHSQRWSAVCSIDHGAEVVSRG